MYVLISIAAIPNFEDAEVQEDGLFEEKLPPASLRDRQIALSTRIFPPLLTNQTSDVQKYIQFGISESNMGNKTVPHVFYFITIAKDDDLIMKELFHSHSGNLTLSLNNEKSNATNGSNGVKVSAAREDIMGAWTSKNSADNITIEAPLFNEGGLYEFKVEILGIDNDTNIFKAINSLEFDSRLSVGNVHQYNVDYKDTETSNVTIISYYDSIQNFSYSSTDGVLAWYMPFDWDIDRLEKDQNILVHNEIQVPSKWFSEDENSIVAYDTGSINSNNNTAVNQANGEVNDERLEGRSFVTDPFSSLDSVTFHYILDKNYLMNLAQNHSTNRSNDNTDDDGYIKFELQGF